MVSAGSYFTLVKAIKTKSSSPVLLKLWAIPGEYKLFQARCHLKKFRIFPWFPHPRL